MSFQGQLKVPDIISAMAELGDQSLGTLYHVPGHLKNKCFQKANPDIVDCTMLQEYDITTHQYRKAYFDVPKTKESVSDAHIPVDMSQWEYTESANDQQQNIEHLNH
jgi:hypothetical protein